MEIKKIEITGNDVIGEGKIEILFSSMDDRSPLSFTFIRGKQKVAFAIHREYIRELAKFIFDQLI